MTKRMPNAPRLGRPPAKRSDPALRRPIRHKIPISDGTALTLIANYPEMSDDDFEQLVGTIKTPRVKKKAYKIRQFSLLLREDPDAKVGDSDSALLARSAMAGSGL